MREKIPPDFSLLRLFSSVRMGFISGSATSPDLLALTSWAVLKWPCKTACKCSLWRFPVALIWTKISRRQRKPQFSFSPSLLSAPNTFVPLSGRKQTLYPQTVHTPSCIPTAFWFSFSKIGSVFTCCWDGPAHSSQKHSWYWLTSWNCGRISLMGTLNLLYLQFTVINQCFHIAVPKYTQTKQLEGRILQQFSYHINSCNGIQTGLGRIVSIVTNSNSERVFNEVNYFPSTAFFGFSFTLATALKIYQQVGSGWECTVRGIQLWKPGWRISADG